MLPAPGQMRPCFNRRWGVGYRINLVDIPSVLRKKYLPKLSGKDGIKIGPNFPQNYVLYLMILWVRRRVQGTIQKKKKVARHSHKGSRGRSTFLVNMLVFLRVFFSCLYHFTKLLLKVIPFIENERKRKLWCWIISDHWLYAIHGSWLQVWASEVHTKRGKTVIPLTF